MLEKALDGLKVSTYLAPETLRTSESRSRMIVLEYNVGVEACR